MFGRIRKLASGRNVLMAFAVFLLSLGAINVIATIFYESTGGYGILDLGGGANLFTDRGSYTPDQAYELMEHYGRTGIERYYAILVADTFFPLTLGVFAMLSILWAMGRIAPRQPWWYAVALLPLVYTVTDWIENAGILALLLNYPQELPWLATYTNIARGVKSVLGSSSLLLAGFTWLLARFHSPAAMTIDSSRQGNTEQ